MKKKVSALFIALSLLMSLLVPAQAASLVEDGQYWKNLTGSKDTQALADRGLEGGHEPILILRYSRYCSYCQKCIPLFREYAEEHGITIYGSDVYTDDVSDFGFFSFGGEVKGAFPIACRYWGNGGAPEVTPGIRTLEDLERLLNAPQPKVSEEGFEIADNGTLLSYHGSSPDIVIPKGVTTIGAYAFQDNTTIKSVIIPDGVTSIGNYAFWGCTSLVSVSMADSVTKMGFYTFDNCKALKNVILSENLTEIPGFAFSSCSQLEELTLPPNLVSIQDEAFFDCGKLRTLTIPAGVTTLGKYLFGNTTNLHTVRFLGHKPSMVNEGQYSTFNDAFFAALLPQGDNSWSDLESLRAAHPTISWNAPPGKCVLPTLSFYSNDWDNGRMSPWARDSLAEVSYYDLFVWGGQTRFNQPVNREDFCQVLLQVLHKHAGIDLYSAWRDAAGAGAFPFTDTRSYPPFAAHMLGLVMGKSEGIFDPKGLITREEAAVILTRAARYLALSHASVPSSFTDRDSISDWAVEGVDYITSVISPVTGKAVMNGTGNGMFSPKDTYTLEQAYITCLSLYQALAGQQFPDYVPSAENSVSN